MKTRIALAIFAIATSMATATVVVSLLIPRQQQQIHVQGQDLIEQTAMYTKIQEELEVIRT
jgi:hypothetical protein